MKRFTAIELSSAHGTLSAFESEGRADAAPVVLLHGAGGNARTWFALAPAFGDRRVLLVDMPGHGRSAGPPDWSLDSIVAIVAGAVRSRLGDARAVWGGHSWGGKVAGLVAAADPSHCAGLVLVDPSPSAAVPIDIEQFVDDIWRDELAPRATPDEAVAAFLAMPHWQPWGAHEEEAFRHGLAQRDDGSWSLRPTREQLVALAGATLHVDESQRLARAAGVPTLLVVAGESEPWQQFTNMATYASATTVVVPGSHWIHLVALDEVARAVQDWLAGC